MSEWVRALAWTGDRTVPARFESHCGKLRFGTLAIPFTPLYQCLSEETLRAVDPFYLVSMPGEVKDPTSPHGNVYLSWTPPLLEKDHSKNNPVYNTQVLVLTVSGEEEESPGLLFNLGVTCPIPLSLWRVLPSLGSCCRGYS